MFFNEPKQTHGYWRGHKILDCHGGADGLAQFAGDAAFFAVRIAALGVQAAETHGLRRFFFGEVNRVFAGEEVFERYAHAFHQFAQQEGFY